MTNNQALYVLLGAIGWAMLSGQASYSSPTGRMIDGFMIMIHATVTTVVGWIGAGSLWVFNTIWLIETMKNVFQAALFAGAVLAGIFANDAAEAQKMANPSTVAGFVVFGALMAMATKRIESLRNVEGVRAKD